MKTLISAALAAAVAATGAAAADLHVASPEALRLALKDAKPGDRILLAPGDFGSLVLSGRRFAPSLTIEAADGEQPPVFASIALSDAGGLTLSGLRVIYGPTGSPLTTYAVNIKRSADIALSKLVVSSAENGVAGDDAYGVNIRDSARIVLTDSYLHDVYRGVAIADCDDVEIARNVIRKVGSDGVVVRGTVGLTVAANSFSDFAIIDLNVQHPDAIQLWSRGAARANESVVIRGNTIRRGDGDRSQGIFIKTPEIATRNILIEGNFVEQSMAQGIFVLNGDGVVIRGNTVVPANAGDRPGIEIRAPSRNATVADNRAVAFRFGPGVTAARNETRQ